MPSVDVAQLTLPIEITGNPVAKLEQVDSELHKDATGGAPAAQAAAEKAGSSLGKMGTGGVKALGSLGNALSTTGDQFGPFQQGIGQISNAIYGSQGIMSGWQQRIFVTGAALTGLGGIAINMGNQIQDSHAKLQKAVANAGDSWDKYSGQVDHAIDRGAHLGKNSSEVQDALARLTTGFGSTKKGLAEMQDAYDLAAFKGISLAQASKELVRINEGYGRGLKELGIDMTFTHNASEQLQKAHDAMGKATEAVTKAQQNEADVQARVAAGGKDNINTQIELRKAHDGVTSAQKDAYVASLKLADAEKKSTEEQKQGATALELTRQKIHDQAEAQANTFGGRLRMIKADIFNFVGEISNKYGSLITSSGMLVMTLSTIGPPLIAAGAAMLSFVGEAAAGMLSLAAASLPVVLPILAIVAAIALVVAAAYFLWTNWDQVWNWITHHPAFAILIGIIAAPIAAFVLLIGGLKWMYDNWNAIWNAAVGVVQAVVGFLQPIIDSISTLVSDVVQFVMDIIHGNWSNLWDDALHIVADVIALIWSTVQVGIDAVVGFFENAPGLIIGALGALAGMLWDTATGFMNSLINAVASGLAGVLTWFGGLPGSILGVLEGIDLFDAGMNVIQGFIDGLASMAGDIIDTASNLASDALDALTSPFHLGSPSREMRKRGVWVMQGFEMGLKDATPPVMDHMGVVANATLASLGNAGTGSASAAGFASTDDDKHGGKAVHVHHHAHVKVEGSVLSERELIQTVRDGLVEAGTNRGGKYLGTVA